MFGSDKQINYLSYEGRKILEFGALPYIKGKAYWSLEIAREPTVVVSSRQVYSLLDMIGDVGGLSDGISLILQPLVSLFEYN